MRSTDQNIGSKRPFGNIVNIVFVPLEHYFDDTIEVFPIPQLLARWQSMLFPKDLALGDLSFRQYRNPHLMQAMELDHSLSQ